MGFFGKQHGLLPLLTLIATISQLRNLLFGHSDGCLVELHQKFKLFCNVGFLLVLSVIFGFVVTGRLLRRVPQWQGIGNWLIWGSPLTLVLTGLFFVSFNPEAAGAGLGVAGLTQRVLVLQIQAWYVLMGWKAFQPSR